MNIPKKLFALFVFMAFSLGVIAGVLTSYPGWVRHGIFLERTRIKSVLEIGDELRRNEDLQEGRLGIDRFREGVSSPAPKAIEM